jgi:hypothetical protein
VLTVVGANRSRNAESRSRPEAFERSHQGRTGPENAEAIRKKLAATDDAGGPRDPAEAGPAALGRRWIAEILEDEPDWKDVLSIVPIELDERAVSEN